MRCSVLVQNLMVIFLAGFAVMGQAVGKDVDFATQIQPLLAKRCYACHGPDDQQGGIRFDQQKSWLAEADSGSIPIVPGLPNQSELISRVASSDESIRMPPADKGLPDSDVELLKAWIEQGAEYSKHWAFQPMTHPKPPHVAAAAQSLVPLDNFVFHKLEAANLNWVGPAEPKELIRRAYLDVIGLPPSPEEVQEWTSQWDEQTYQRLVDHLLGNPAMGDRWARMWLDVVRYAESNSFERDNPKPNAWKYRDYVIDAFNSDRPYDQFVREQIAGDELDSVTQESLIATGYYRLGIWDDEPADPLQAEFDGYDDIVSTTGQAFLGLTFGCARCHDHKIDPITQRDYYSLVAFVRDVTPYGTRVDQVSSNQLDLDPKVKTEHEALEAAIKQLEQQVQRLEQSAIVKMPAPDQRATEGNDRERVLREKLHDFMDVSTWSVYCAKKQQLVETQQQKSQLPPRVTTLGLAKLDPQPAVTHVLLRGSPHSEGDPVELAFPSLFEQNGEIASDATQSNLNSQSVGRRRVLADWLASDDNWLTARVIVNRIWLHYFGRGIVRSPNNFGLMGDPPTHPELLDYLATQLIESGWSLKHIHRQILLSATYRRSSANREDSLAADPMNNYFWRQNLKRLSAEQVRDSILSVSGQINLAQTGPPMYPTLSAEVHASQSVPGLNWEKSPESEQARRSIYIHVKRSLPVPMLSVFDFPETDQSCEARFLTTQPAQALTMLNNDWMQRQAQALFERVQGEVGDRLEDQAARCLELVYCRPSGSADDLKEDVHALRKLVDRLKNQEQWNDADARRAMCLVALNLNHFIYMD